MTDKTGLRTGGAGIHTLCRQNMDVFTIWSDTTNDPLSEMLVDKAMDSANPRTWIGPKDEEMVRPTHLPHANSLQ